MSTEKVYLVTVGEYSDYRVVGAFTTQEKAKLFIDRLQWDRGDDPDIEEHDLDLWLPQLREGYSVWFVKMMANGDVVGIGSETGALHLGLALMPSGDFRWFEKQSFALAYVYARDEEHAVKIVNERRIRWKADPANQVPER